MRAARCPADDPLDARSIAEAQAARPHLAIPDKARVLTSPALCARETAAALGLEATVDEALTDLNYGEWRGRRLADLASEAPQELATWTRDPDASPPGGESFSQLVERIGAWLDALDANAPSEASASGNVVAITHAPVLRAAIVGALGASPAVFPRIEIAPLSAVELRHTQRGWTWRPAAL